MKIIYPTICLKCKIETTDVGSHMHCPNCNSLYWKQVIDMPDSKFALSFIWTNFPDVICSHCKKSIKGFYAVIYYRDSKIALIDEHCMRSFNMIDPNFEFENRNRKIPEIKFTKEFMLWADQQINQKAVVV